MIATQIVAYSAAAGAFILVWAVLEIAAQLKRIADALEKRDT